MEKFSAVSLSRSCQEVQFFGPGGKPKWHFKKVEDTGHRSLVWMALRSLDKIERRIRKESASSVQVKPHETQKYWLYWLEGCLLPFRLRTRLCSKWGQTWFAFPYLFKQPEWSGTMLYCLPCTWSYLEPSCHVCISFYTSECPFLGASSVCQAALRCTVARRSSWCRRQILRIIADADTRTENQRAKTTDIRLEDQTNIIYSDTNWLKHVGSILWYSLWHTSNRWDNGTTITFERLSHPFKSQLSCDKASHKEFCYASKLWPTATLATSNRNLTY